MLAFGPFVVSLALTHLVLNELEYYWSSWNTPAHRNTTPPLCWRMQANFDLDATREIDFCEEQKPLHLLNHFRRGSNFSMFKYHPNIKSRQQGKNLASNS